MKTTVRLCLLSLVGALSAAGAFADGTFVPTYEEREYEGSLEQKAQEAIVVYQDWVEDLILKVTYQGKPKDFAWVIPFPSAPDISKADAQLFKEIFDYVEHEIAERSRGWGVKWGKSKEATEESLGVEVIARKIVGSYETTTVRETVAGALNRWLKENDYAELTGAEEELEYYRKQGWVYAAIKVRDAIAEGEGVDLHPLRFTFKTREEDAMVYPLKLSAFQKTPLDVNLYVFADWTINIDYDEKAVLTKRFNARYESGSARKWSHEQVEGTLPMLATRRFFLKDYPHETFFLTNIQALGLKPDDIRDWTEDLYIYPQYVYLFDPSTWYWPQWLALFGGIGGVIVIIVIVVRLRRKKKAASSGT